MIDSEITTEEADVLAMLARDTYEEVAKATGWSRGRIYALALKHGARKTETRIREKAVDRRRRRQETLAAIIQDTTTSDVLDFMDGLPDASADLVLTSPPYNLGKAYGGGVSADSMRFTYYIGWMMQVISEASRVLKDGGVLFLQVGATRDETGRIMPLDIALYDVIKQTGLTYQNRIAWVIGHGLTPKARLSGRYETALVFSKGEPRNFNFNAVRVPQKQPEKRAHKGPNRGSLSGHPLGAWPSDVMAISNVGHNAPERTGHPAQMPAELARRAVQLYTMPGDLVVDPFSGSGTTHEVCVETGRSFVGADLHYGDLRAARLAKAGLANLCPLPGVTDQSVAVWQAEARKVEHRVADGQLDLLDAA